jgi:glycosyltransferase involved in cell wall biosynthesis
MIRLKDNGTLNFNMLAPMASADGYGYSAEELIAAATKDHGANIGFITHDWVDKKYTSQFVQDLELPRDQIGQKEVLVVYFIPYAFYQHAGLTHRLFGQTMFETTEIPDIWAQCCNDNTDGLIVPSEFNKEVFQKKVDKQIEVVPLGVNIDTYKYVERSPSKTFTFLMAGLLHYRKGAEFAVRAFKQEFARSEPVRLVLKTRKGFLDIGAETLDDPRIVVADDEYTRAEMLDLYHAGDCFIACSRGEASGLTPREAMATGIPAIVTNWGGLSEIANPRYTYPIDVEDEEEAPRVCSSYDVGITQGQAIGNFSRPSISSLRAAMREAYENRTETAAKGLAASNWIAREWNYTVCTKKWLTAIERLYDEKP